MNEFISKASTVEDAIDRGLHVMNISQKDVNIEVLQVNTKGFIGIGKKQAIVKLKRIKNTQQNIEKTTNSVPNLEKFVQEALNEYKETEELVKKPPMNTTVEEEKEGVAWIQNNELFVNSSHDKYATASIKEGITLYKNEEKITKQTILLSKDDEYRVEYEEFYEKPMSWKISIIKNEIEAILDVYPGEKISRNLKDVAPSEHITIELQSQKEPVNTLSKADILAELDNKNIIFGLNHTAIENALETKEQGRFVIAVGKEVKHGVDGELEVKVDTDMANGLVEDEHGNIDFKEANVIPNVEIGVIMAILHPPIPGLPGRSVLDKELLPRQPLELKFIPGKGVDVKEDKIIATESGRPVIEQRGRIVKAMIMSKLVHQGNVNITTGNIRFSGDIEIVGEVEDNMIVEAGGDIFVHRSINESNITASKSITAKGNVNNSNLTAGKQHLLVLELGHLLKTLEEQVGKMIIIIKQLMDSKQYKSKEFQSKGLQPLIIILSEKKFMDVKVLAKKYVDIVERAEAYIEEPEWKKIGYDLKTMFLTLSQEIITIDKLTILQELMQDIANTTNSEVEPNSYVTISDTTNSRIYSSGNINIIGKGCINTKVHSGGLLKIDGILRGGEVYGRLGVTVGEAGAISGTKTVIATATGNSVTIMRAHEGTVIRIGETVRKLLKEEKFIQAKLDDDGQIIFE